MELTVALTDIGDGISSGLVTAILPKVGEAINEGDTLIEIETDKAVIPFPSPDNGTLSQLLIQEGAEIKVGDKIATLTTDQSQSSTPPSPSSEESPSSTPPPPSEHHRPKTSETIEESIEKPAPPNAQVSTEAKKAIQATKIPAESPTSQAPAPQVTPSIPAQPVHKMPEGATEHYHTIAASPGTRKLARELDITLNVVAGSGRSGRITMDDLKSYVKQSLQNRPSAGSGSASGSAQAAQPLPDFSEFGAVEVKQVSRLRQTIARNMHISWSTIPHVHHNSKFDLSVITKWQQLHHGHFKENGSTLSVTPILIKALAHALKEFPEFNASFDAAKSELHYKKFYNIGVAVDTEAGLIVPVIKHVDKLSVFEIGRVLREIAKKTRERKIGLNDLKGACLTLSNLGGIGGEHFTPIINPPEVAILGVARTTYEVKLDETKQPVSIPMLPVTLGYDHRVIDGAVAARFLVRLKTLIEAPEILLMGIELTNK